MSRSDFWDTMYTYCKKTIKFAVDILPLSLIFAFINIDWHKSLQIGFLAFFLLIFREKNRIKFLLASLLIAFLVFQFFDPVIVRLYSGLQGCVDCFSLLKNLSFALFITSLTAFVYFNRRSANKFTFLNALIIAAFVLSLAGLLRLALSTTAFRVGNLTLSAVLNPVDFSIYQKLAVNYEARGQWHNAGIQYEKSARLQLNKDFYLKAASNFTKAGEWDSVYSNLYEIDDPDIPVWDRIIADFTGKGANFNLARAYLNNAMTEKAIGEFEKIVSTQGYNRQVYYYQGLCYEKEGNIAKAIECYNMEIRKDPGNLNSRLRLVDIYGSDRINKQEAELQLAKRIKILAKARDFKGKGKIYYLEDSVCFGGSGMISGRIFVPKTRFLKLGIIAKCKFALKLGPIATLAIDGKVIKKVCIDSDNWAVYQLGRIPKPGPHWITITYPRDYYEERRVSQGWPEDANINRVLYVDKIIIFS